MDQNSADKKDAPDHLHIGHALEGKHHHHRHSRHRWLKFKRTLKTYLLVTIICLLAALLFTYITGSIPRFMEKTISLHVEKAMQRLRGISTERKTGNENIKNPDVGKIKDESFKALGGWEGDRGERQVEEEHKKTIEQTFGHGSAWDEPVANEQKRDTEDSGVGEK